MLTNIGKKAGGELIKNTMSYILEATPLETAALLAPTSYIYNHPNKRD